MDHWEDGFCSRLAAEGRLVIRFDYRDTGRSTSYPPGQPGRISGMDLVADAIAILDSLGVGDAHIVGVSMGGGLAQRLAVEPSRPCREPDADVDDARRGARRGTAPGCRRDCGSSSRKSRRRRTFAEEPPSPDWTTARASWSTWSRPIGRSPEPPSSTRTDLATWPGASMTAPMPSRPAGRATAAGRRRGTARRPGRPRGTTSARVARLARPVVPRHGRALAGAIRGAQVRRDGRRRAPYPPARTWELVIGELVAVTALKDGGRLAAPSED